MQGKRMSDTLKKTLEENARYYRLQERETLAALSGLPKGSIKEKRTASGTYYYLQHRLRGKMVQRYLGRRFPEEIAGQIERRKQLRKQLNEVRGALRMLGRKTDDDLLEPVRDFLMALGERGLWEDGAEVVGSWCFRIYQQYLGVRSYPVHIDDIDILIPLPWKGRTIDLAELLRRMGFVEHFHVDGSTSYIRPGLRVDFLSPRRRPRKTKGTGLGVVPQELVFIDLLLERPLRLKLMAGVWVRVPAPAAFVLHKLIVADRRSAPDKREKDLIQALSVARFVLGSEEQREELLEAWAGMIASWRKKVLASLSRAARDFPLEEDVVEALVARLTGD